MLNKKYFILKKNERNKKSNFFINSPKKLYDISLNRKKLSLSDLICYSPIGKNKTKLMISSLLSSSKGIMINKNKFSSSTTFPKNFHHFYPYRPNSSKFTSNLSHSEEKTKLLLSPDIGESVYNLKGNILSKNALSFDLSMSPKYKRNNERYFSPKKKKLFINGDSFKLISSIKYFRNKKYNIEDNKNNSNETKMIKDKLPLDELKFVHFIDEINKDSNYINKCKKELRDYFIIDEKNIGTKSFFEKLLFKYRFEEHEHENYFLTDLYSVKRNSFNIGNINISFKLSSLEFIFYEIAEDELNKRNIDSILFYNIESNKSIKYNINSKIKFPFEFLSIFYGINFNEFINLLISIIEYDYKNNRFSIDHNNFIAKIEMGKTLYDFYTESSYFYINNNISSNKECFLFDWDVKCTNSKTIKHFVLKIVLPQMKINIKCANMIKIKFFLTTSIKKMGDLMKNSFYQWDYFILLTFSEFKQFRYEINKILCGKYLNINKDFSNIENIFKSEKKLKKMRFNLNKMIIILNTIKKNNQSYGFFYSHKKLNNENEIFFISLKLPQISISYQDLLSTFNKKFDIDIKRLSQLNKLRKFFCIEDIIKYSMIIRRSKYREENSEKPKFQKYLSIKKPLKSNYKRSTSVITRDKSRKNSINSNLKKQSTKQNRLKETIKFNKNLNNNDLFIKDIKLNLDKYIFNFDESILKYIKSKDNNKNDTNVRYIENNNSFKRDNICLKNNMDFAKNEKKLDIKIGNIELSWTNQNGLTKELTLDKKQTEHLLDYPTSNWKFFIEKNIEKILENEKNIIKPIKNSSKKNFVWKEFITNKEIKNNNKK